MLFRLLFRNAFRNRLRSGLTILGVALAILAFGLLRTLIGAWYAGVEASSATRLVTRNAISLIFPLPFSYKEKSARSAASRRSPGATGSAGSTSTRRTSSPILPSILKRI